MRQQNVIIFSSGKNKRVAHEIARGLDGDVCKVVVWDEFFNKIYGEEYTLTKSYAMFQFLIKKIQSIAAVERYPKLLSETRAFLGEHLYGISYSRRDLAVVSENFHLDYALSTK